MPRSKAGVAGVGVLIVLLLSLPLLLLRLLPGHLCGAEETGHTTVEQAVDSGGGGMQELTESTTTFSTEVVPVPVK